jgi:hypothetical protein
VTYLKVTLANPGRQQRTAVGASSLPRCMSGCASQWPAPATLGAVVNPKRSDGNLTHCRAGGIRLFRPSFLFFGGGHAPGYFSYEYENMRVTGKAICKSMKVKDGLSTGCGVALCDEATIRLELGVDAVRTLATAIQRGGQEFRRDFRRSFALRNRTKSKPREVLGITFPLLRACASLWLAIRRSRRPDRFLHACYQTLTASLGWQQGCQIEGFWQIDCTS